MTFEIEVYSKGKFLRYEFFDDFTSARKRLVDIGYRYKNEREYAKGPWPIFERVRRDSERQIQEDLLADSE